MYIYTDLYLYSSNEEFAIYDKTHKSQCSSPTYQYYTAMLDAHWQKTRQMSDSLLCCYYTTTPENVTNCKQ